MALYKYSARDNSAKLVNGTIAADSEGLVVNRIRELGMIPISVELTVEKNTLGSFLGRFRKIKLSEINMFTRQFFVLQRAGIPIVRSLQALKEQASNKDLKEAIDEITSDIKAGKSLSIALSKHKTIFNSLYINMVSVGEESGNLADVFERLAILGEHEEKMLMQIKTATRYPVIVVCAIVAAFLVLTVLVIPRFAHVYKSAGISLPLPTQILIWINYAITKFWWLLIIIGTSSIFMFKKLVNTKEGRLRWDALKLKLPVFGGLILKISLARFTRVTATLMHSGVPILRILELASSGTGNVVVSRVIDDIKNSVKEGKGIAGPVKASGFFPPIVTQMISVGEETGRVDELLLHVADYYDSQVDYMIKNFTSLIEPLLLLFLGAGVLMMALGIFLPMWNMMALFRR